MFKPYDIVVVPTSFFEDGFLDVVKEVTNRKVILKCGREYDLKGARFIGRNNFNGIRLATTEEIQENSRIKNILTINNWLDKMDSDDILAVMKFIEIRESL